jgi:predicted metal-dependent hydrolase
MRRLKRMLPAEGWLTQRLARLREKAHLARKGHVARIDELRLVLDKLAPEAKKRASQELAARYKELQLDTRLERLDAIAAENERRIRLLNGEAQTALQRYDYRRLSELLKAAEKLQKHNGWLLKHIERAESKLAQLTQQIAGAAR